MVARAGGGDGTVAGRRGQAHTLEAFTASVLLLASVVFALQVTAVTPLTASTSSQHIENQQAGVARGVLDSATANGTLKPALLYWSDSAGRFHGASSRGYTLGGPPGFAFGEMLNRTFRDRGIAVDVDVTYLTADRDRRTQMMVNFGQASSHAVTARRTVTLYDDDVLYAADGQPTDVTLEAADSFYAPDAASGSDVYNVVVVEVTVWRM